MSQIGMIDKREGMNYTNVGNDWSGLAQCYGYRRPFSHQGPRPLTTKLNHVL